MSQSAARKARRECKRLGHLPKTDGSGVIWCARCGEQCDYNGQPVTPAERKAS